MKQPQIDGLKARRDQLVGMREQLSGDESTGDAAGRAQSIAEIDEVLQQIDKVLSAAAPKPRKVRAPRLTMDHQQVVDLTRIRKTDRAEVRVVVKEWKGRRTVDVRLWYLPDGETEMAPSRKGVSIDAGKLGALITALRLAEQHLGG